MERKKIVFMGTPQFAVPILEALCADETNEVVAVVTQPDRLVGRKKVMTPPPVKVCAQHHHIPVYQPERLANSSEQTALLSQPVDLVVTAAYGQMIPNVLLKHPRFGAVNVHASLLPKYRGGAPVHYALLEGEATTGITLMVMEEKMDAGAILAQKAIPIHDSDTVSSLFDKLSVLGRDLLQEHLPLIWQQRLTATAQDESQVTYAPNITAAQEVLDWQQPASQIANHIRAMNAWPGAYTWWRNQRFKIWRAEPIAETHTAEQPGTVLLADKKRLWVACGQHTVLSLLEVQPAGKPMRTVSAFLAGGHIKAGDYFGQS